VKFKEGKGFPLRESGLDASRSESGELDVGVLVIYWTRPSVVKDN